MAADRSDTSSTQAFISVDKAAIAAFCRRHEVARLSFFGSILSDRFLPSSDVDVLVEFLPQSRAGLFQLVAMQTELAGILGRTVDLRTPGELSSMFREEVMRRAQVQYAA